ncbi:inositol monophosphatase [Paenarthrobacter sp. Z7-10]|nr:inositol monophosphatase [Paenarthrobacter sp. Z7-10]
MKWVLNLGVDAVTTNRLTLLQSIVASAPESTAGAEPPPRLSSAELALAFEVAHELGEWAIGYTSSADRGAISTKTNPADLVTEVDLAVERHVREVIAARFPEHGFVGEEMGGTAAAGVPCWYLDPVDGTTNFANRVPWTAFSLALAIDRTPVLGVVADPWRGDLFEAVAGYGARLNGESLRIPDDDHAGRDPLSGTVVGTELAAHLAWPGMLPMLEALGSRHATMRIMGSGTMTVVGVAAGRGAGAVIGSFGPVDHLAALLIVAEAGGVVLDSEGVPNLFPSTGGILAASPPAAQELYEVWRTARAEAK